MKIEVLGPGCPRCQALEANVKEAVKELGIDAEVEKVTDVAKITAYGIMSTPGIAVDGKVKGFGKLFSVEEIKEMLA
ncbi:MAG TPA: thioredoxin family protein [Dissulfuribacter thermophilus]|uniref:Thioredoxin family protein n=1 Tax=Dissulfuribacter thermophilus TaxID=1156395 RepID=A0A7V2WSZ5_9BACT|nr:thioredoxin family protein [Dissulfuribacter thermophilus]